MAYEIRTMSVLEYLLTLSGERHALLDRSVDVAASGGRLVGRFEDGQCKGLVCCVTEGSYERVLYAYTLRAWRRRGVLSSLLAYVVATTRYALRLVVASDAVAHDAVEAACRALGFRGAEGVHVFSFDLARGRDPWEHMMARRGARMCAYLGAHGYEACRLSDASADVWRQVRHSAADPFQNALDPAPLMDNPRRRLSREASYAVTREGALVAYTLVCEPSRDAFVFDQVSTAAWSRGTGVALLGVVKSMEGLFARAKGTCTFAMHPSNTAANRLRAPLMEGIAYREVVYESFVRARPAHVPAGMDEPFGP